MQLDKPVRAVTPVIAIGILLVLFSLILQLLPFLFSGDPGMEDMLKTLNYGGFIFFFLVFFLLYALTGVRAVAIYRLDVFTAALATAAASAISGLFDVLAGFVLDLLIVMRVIPALGFQSLQTVLSLVVFGKMNATVTVALSLLCGIFLVFIKALAAFLLATLGGFLLELHRSRS